MLTAMITAPFTVGAVSWFTLVAALLETVCAAVGQS